MGGKGTRLQLRKKLITESAGFVSTFQTQHDAVDDEKERVRRCVNEIRTHDTPMNDESSDGGWRMEGKMDEGEHEDEDREEKKSWRASEE